MRDPLVIRYGLFCFEFFEGSLLGAPSAGFDFCKHSAGFFIVEVVDFLLRHSFYPGIRPDFFMTVGLFSLEVVEGSLYCRPLGSVAYLYSRSSSLGRLIYSRGLRLFGFC